MRTAIAHLALVLTTATACFAVLAAAPVATAQEVTAAEVTTAVESELWADNAVTANAIDVETADGVVTLKNAFQGGAKDVRNKLEVNFPYYGPYGPGYYGSPYYHSPNYYGPSYKPRQDSSS